MRDLLRRAWMRWKAFGQIIGNIQARLFLSVFYFVVLGPFALAVRWWGDPLAIRAGSPRGWQPKSHSDGKKPMDLATRQF